MSEPTRIDTVGSALTRSAQNSTGDSMPDAATRARFKSLVDAVARHESAPESRQSGRAPADRSMPHQEDRPESVSPFFSPRPALESSPSHAPFRSTAVAQDEIAELLRRFCSALFVGDPSTASGKHVWLALDSALAGAAAEFIRDGAVLRVNLHARNASTLRLMTAQRDSLHRALADATDLSVQVAVIDDEGMTNGSAT